MACDCCEALAAADVYELRGRKGMHFFPQTFPLAKKVDDFLKVSLTISFVTWLNKKVTLKS